MSHIHDALKRAQKEKDSLYKSYGGIISESGLAGKRRRHRYAIVFSVIFLALAVLGLLGYNIPWIMEAKSGREANPAAVVQDTGIRPAAKAEQKLQGRKDIESLYAEALTVQRDGFLDRAEGLYREILEIDPDYAFAANNLGVIYLTRRETASARESFERAIELKADYVDPYYNLACLYTCGGDRVKGLEYLKEALRLNNDVKNWAKDDRDLEGLRDLTEFRILMGSSSAE